jgi:hypothetical protein
LEFEGSQPHDLLEMKLILCDLKDYIAESSEVDYFFLQGVEAADAQFVQVIRPFATWNKVVRRDGKPVPEVDDSSLAIKPVRRRKRIGRPRGR